ncbi:MAG: phosphatase PAP2 family protein [Clostridia bacterium]|nr:phosphatase PAP2 family protein [Clostridia bacterium]
MVNKILPKYSIIPIAIFLAFHLSLFYLTRLFTNSRPHYDLSIALDYSIPFIAAFIVIYILAFAQWGFGLYYIANSGKDVCFKTIAAALIGEIICLAFFLILPTEFPADMPRPDVSGSGVFTWITRLIYSLDEPNNLFPSLHCFASWMCFRAIFYVEKEKRNRVYTVVSCIFSILVFASTVFVKQHLFVDIIGGVALVEIAILIEKATGAHRLLYALDKKIFKNTDDAGEEI